MDDGHWQNENGIMRLIFFLEDHSIVLQAFYEASLTWRSRSLSYYCIGLFNKVNTSLQVKGLFMKKRPSFLPYAWLYWESVKGDLDVSYIIYAEPRMKNLDKCGVLKRSYLTYFNDNY